MTSPNDLRAAGWEEVFPGHWAKPSKIESAPGSIFIEPDCQPASLESQPIGRDKVADGKSKRLKSNPSAFSGTESDLQREICQLLRLKGIWFASTITGRRTTARTGTPDLLLAINGHPIAWELKVGANKMTPEQVETFNKMRINGWDCQEIRSTAEVFMILNGYGV